MGGPGSVGVGDPHSPFETFRNEESFRFTRASSPRWALRSALDPWRIRTTHPRRGAARATSLAHRHSGRGTQWPFARGGAPLCPEPPFRYLDRGKPDPSPPKPGGVPGASHPRRGSDMQRASLKLRLARLSAGAVVLLSLSMPAHGALHGAGGGHPGEVPPEKGEHAPQPPSHHGHGGHHGGPGHSPDPESAGVDLPPSDSHEEGTAPLSCPCCPGPCPCPPGVAADGGPEEWVGLPASPGFVPTPRAGVGPRPTPTDFLQPPANAPPLLPA